MPPHDRAVGLFRLGFLSRMNHPSRVNDPELLAYEREHDGGPFRPPVQHIRHCLPRHGSPIACITWIAIWICAQQSITGSAD
jgi:hypothetical protein